MTTPDRAAAPAPLAERLRELMAKATPGPWKADHIVEDDSVCIYRDHPEVDGAAESLFVADWGTADDAEFIVAIVNNLPTLLAALDGREAGWLPIEGAPRDGTKVDLWITPPSGQLVGSGYGREPDCWFSNGKWWRHDEAYGDDDGCRKVRNATHWRPLPAPPARPRCPQSGAPEPAGEPE